MVRNFGSYGSLIMLDSKARNVVAVCSASNTSPACTTNSSSRVATRSCKRSHAEKEKLAEPATLSNSLDNSILIAFLDQLLHIVRILLNLCNHVQFHLNHVQCGLFVEGARHTVVAARHAVVAAGTVAPSVVAAAASQPRRPLRVIGCEVEQLTGESNRN